MVTIRLPAPEIQVSSFLVFFAPTPLKRVCATAHSKIRAYKMDHKILGHSSNLGPCAVAFLAARCEVFPIRTR